MLNSWKSAKFRKFKEREWGKKATMSAFGQQPIEKELCIAIPLKGGSGVNSFENLSFLAKFWFRW